MSGLTPTAAAVMDRLARAGIRLTAAPPDLIAAPRERLTDELRALVKAHKPELLRALAEPPNPTRAPAQLGPRPAVAPEKKAEAVAAAELTQRLQAEIAKRRDLELVVISDDELIEGAVLVAVGRRGSFSVVLRVDAARWDGVRVIELIGRHGGTLH